MGLEGKWNLGQPFHGFFDFREVWRRFLERDAFHDQVHGPLVDKVMYDFGDAWRIGRLRLLCMVVDEFLSCELGLKILLGAILYEVILPDVYAGSVVIFPPVSFLVLFARGYQFGLEFLVHCRVSWLVRRKEGKEDCKLRRTSRLGATRSHSTVPKSKARERGC